MFILNIESCMVCSICQVTCKETKSIIDHTFIPDIIKHSLNIEELLHELMSQSLILSGIFIQQV